MNSLLVLIPLSIGLLAVAAFAFFWAVDHDQLEDFDSAGLQPLLDSEKPQVPEAKDRVP